MENQLYEPPKPPAPAEPKPQYELKKDVTGQDRPKRGPQVLKAIRYDEEGKRVEVQFKVPTTPNPKCKKCYGRGYVGFEAGTNALYPCKKCFPML